MKKLFIAVLLSTLLTACHTIRETASQYERLPIKSVKTPSKEGRACVSYSFPASLFYSNADLSVESARERGGITDIVTIEKEVSSSIGYQKICTIVRGN